VKISRIVGKNCYAPAEDVKLVQTALSYIKVRTKFGLKPLWDPGKIDGKNSQLLTEAIICFQQTEKLTVTGKIEPSGRCINTLKQKIPAGARAMLAQQGSTGSTVQNTFKGRFLKAGNSFFASQQLIDFLKGWENFEPKAKADPAGNCTIGFGKKLYPGACNGTHPLEIKHASKPMTPAEGELLLGQDVARAESDVKRWLGQTRVTQSMYDALVSLVFNAGGAGGPTPTTTSPGAPKLWNNVGLGKFPVAAKEFLDIDNATDVNTGTRSKLGGLTKRRRAESDMFLNANYSGRP